MSAQDKRDMVYDMVVQSQKTGITIDKIASRLEGDILAPHYVAQLVIALRIKSITKGIMGPVYYVAVEMDIKEPLGSA